MKEDTFNVLLIEDDEDDYILTCDALAQIKGANYEIEWISNYARGFDAVMRGNHDVCLIDYRLDEGNGIDLIRKAVAEGCHTPMLLLTGQGDQEIDFEATEAGAFDYLVKGEIEPLFLERTIRYAVKQARMKEKLHESENRFRSIIESASDAIILTDSAGRILSWNTSAQMIFGYAPVEVLHRPLSYLFSVKHCGRAGKDMKLLLSSGILRLGNRSVELSGVRKYGEEFPLEISLSSWETSKGVFYGGIIRDVTERKEMVNQLTHQALHDPLTKLANRLLFHNRVEHALTRLERHNKPLAVLFLDLDNFKTVNDLLGLPAGDQLLVSVAERLTSCLRAGDTAARLGGDEFAILVEDAGQTNYAALVAERITDVLSEPFVIEGKKINVSTSIGIAVTLMGRESSAELLRNAEVAMYKAKNEGKNRYVVFENQMHDALVERMEIEADLRRSVECNEFVVYYQPIIDMKCGRMMGMEALVRWQHPTRGLIQPLDFISIAEETGLIVPLGRWVLETACQQANDWRRDYFANNSFSLTVNLSGVQFQQPNIIDTVANALEKSDLPPACLVLEVTENIMLQKTEGTILKLQKLKDLGIRLAIDDFGTGYSSLSYLQRFPVDILKIDKSFVDKINIGREGAAVARAIITMSDTLKLQTVAEGIEKSEQISTLQEMGCEFGQGYHFSKPLSTKDMEEFFLIMNRS